MFMFRGVSAARPALCHVDGKQTASGGIMSRKSRQRMMYGRVAARDGETRYGAALKVPPLDKYGSLTPKRRAALLAYLTGIPEDHRLAVREYLRQDGGERALALLGELEREWAAS
jgi:hypothetical protein